MDNDEREKLKREILVELAELVTEGAFKKSVEPINESLALIKSMLEARNERLASIEFRLEAVEQRLGIQRYFGER